MEARKKLEKRLKWLFDEEQQLGINEQDRFHNSEKGKKQYEALSENHPSYNSEFTKPNLLKKINGWLRLWVWGVCPEFNHDAPELYDCEICKYYKNLSRYRSEQSKKQKQIVWDKFLNGEKELSNEELTAKLERYKRGDFS